ncbi:MAG: hypothetical protein KF696_04530 [Planctomycetes bacterium]|nr:hypothetical protein [Planctomycetota bacterium]MCW8134239.1 hypothetical protein [Planctomycetota bacterium]
MLLDELVYGTSPRDLQGTFTGEYLTADVAWLEANFLAEVFSGKPGSDIHGPDGKWTAWRAPTEQDLDRLTELAAAGNQLAQHVLADHAGHSLIAARTERLRAEHATQYSAELARKDSEREERRRSEVVEEREAWFTLMRDAFLAALEEHDRRKAGKRKKSE